MKRSNGFDRAGLHARAIQIVTFSLCGFMLTGCGERLKRLESNQIIMEEKVDANTNRIEIMTYKLEKSQAQLRAALEEVRKSNEITLAEAIATRYEQRKLREASDANDDLIRTGVSQIREKQKILGQSLDQVDSHARKIGADVVALAGDQARLRQRISGGHKEVVSEIGAVKENQEKTNGLSVQVLSHAQTISDGVGQIRRDQSMLLRTVKNSDQQLKADIAGMGQRQQETQKTLSDTQAVSLTIANHVGQLQNTQANLLQLSRTHADQLNSGVAQVQRLQEQQAGLDEFVKTQAVQLNGNVTELQRHHVSLATGVQQNRDLGQTVATELGRVKAQLNNGIAQVQALQLHQQGLQTLVRTQADKIQVSVSDVLNRQIGLSSDIQKNQHAAQATVTGLGSLQEKLDSGMTQVQALQLGQAGLNELVRTRSDKLDTSLAGLQRQQAGLSAGVQKNHDVASTIVTDVKKVQDQQEALRELIQGEADAMGDVLTEMGQAQNRLAMDLDNNLKTVTNIKGDLSQGQVKQVSGRMQAVEGSVASLDGSVSGLETRLVVLSAAMQTYQQERAKVDASLTESVAALAKALEQIKVNQMLLSRRVGQTRDDARVYNERVQATLQQLRKDSTRSTPEPKLRRLPPQDPPENESDK